MDLRSKSTAVLLALAAACAPLGTQAACRVQSGPKTVALVELYTSEGCSSCPPADQVLAQLPAVLGAGAVAVPLALHVDYWDAIGWKDPYAQAAFSQRHEGLVHANHHTTVYTPHFFVSGTELDSGSPELATEVGRVNARPAMASIRIEGATSTHGGITIDVDARSLAGTEPATLQVVLAESHLVSHVARGENAGARLTHDHVARTWLAPIALSHGEAHLRRDLALPAGADRAQLELIAFVQDERTGRVLQALDASSCTRSGGGP